MRFEKIVSEGIVSNSYFIASDSKAVIIDPRRDVDIYLKLARKYDVEIVAIFDTHRNEDFVNGSPQLAHITQAEIYHGNKLNFKYGTGVKDGDSFQIEDLEFGILETPGHTPESISITLKTEYERDQPYMVFTGDTLFAGDVGRIDFYRDDQKQAQAANWLYESLHKKLLTLGDGTIVLPAHGAGSICGGKITGVPFTTIGYEKKTNQRLHLSKEEFINFKSKEKFEIAPNMTKLEELNIEAPPILQQNIQPKAMTVQEVKEHLAKGSQVIDIREPESFAGGHIPNTLNIWENGLPTHGLWMLNYEQPIILIKGSHQDINLSVKYLIRLGFDNIIGYLQGFRDWYIKGEKYYATNVWSVHDLNNHLGDADLFVLDVRTKRNVMEEGKITGSKHIYLGNIAKQLKEIPRDKKIAVYCDSGFKTFTAVSLLLQNDFKNVYGVIGSMSAWKNAGYSVNE
ncbi:MAG: MBL fold metallo-hydrolase [Candidatus Heimdallarchaeota archaeon]|nr:MBL fold metallo-hydrolase [Candidatus Heimdallarchaeota archaeon]